MFDYNRMSEVLAEMIDSRGSRRAFAEKIGMPPTTLQSMLTKGLARASITSVISICKELGITVEELEKMTTQEDDSVFKDTTQEMPSLHNEEQLLINKYRTLDAKGKHTVRTVLEMEYNRIHNSHLDVVAAHNDDYSEEQIELMKEDLDKL